MTNDISKLMIELGESARLSAEYLARTPNQQRNEAISCIAQSIKKNTNKILAYIARCEEIICSKLTF